MHLADKNFNPPYDEVINNIADYVVDYQIDSKLAYETAALCLLDTLGCGIFALKFPECKKLLGPVVPGANLDTGARVPGTDFALDPVQAAFNIGAMNRWLDYNDTWLAKEWGHPSDNLAAILAVADYMDRNKHTGKFLVKDILTSMIKAHEIQGVFALENSFNRVGLDHVFLVKLASSALSSYLLGGDKNLIMRTISQVFADGQSLRVYRHAPNTGSRKSWAAADAAARGVWLSLVSQKGEMGYPSVLTTPNWGFYDVSFKGNEFKLNQEYSTYVMENILFKVSYPAEFHAQTAVECAIKLHEIIKDKIHSIKTIKLITHESAIRIISKSGVLNNPADRDHCLQYMVAVALLNGNLTAENYEDDFAKNPMIDTLRAKMEVSENPEFSRDYLSPEKRSIANSIQIFFEDGTSTELITIEYPLGHRNRREESLPFILEKFKKNVSWFFDSSTVNEVLENFNDLEKLQTMSLNDFMNLWSVKK